MQVRLDFLPSSLARRESFTSWNSKPPPADRVTCSTLKVLCDLREKWVVAEDVILTYPPIGQDPESIELERAVAAGSRRHPAAEMQVGSTRVFRRGQGDVGTDASDGIVDHADRPRLITHDVAGNLVNAGMSDISGLAQNDLNPSIVQPRAIVGS